MMEIFQGKTVDEAKAKAAEAFGVDEALITFEVIEEPKKGLFGVLKSEAKVKAEYVEPEMTKLKKAEAYILSVVGKMGIPVEITTTEVEGGAIINLDCGETGSIIGRRGDTLDALQYLTSMICNKDDDEYYRITIDSNGYREKRKATLEDLARKIAKNVIRTGRPTTLEPMNPYERRIIHSIIAEINGVVSRSIGDEPYRKVIVSSTVKRPNNNERAGDKRRGGFNNNRGGNRDNRNRDNRTHNRGEKRDFTARSLDLKTSFEKDYKKPKPEDNIKAGLYGKIEF